jgi:hypothetical protein
MLSKGKTHSKIKNYNSNNTLRKDAFGENFVPYRRLSIRLFNRPRPQNRFRPASPGGFAKGLKTSPDHLSDFFGLRPD